MTASLSYPSHFVGSRRAKLALGWHIVNGANDVPGGGCFIRPRSYPHPALRATLRASFARLDPTKIGGGRKTANAVCTVRNNSARNSHTHPHTRDLAARARVLIDVKRI